MEKAEPRVGVYICHCGTNIAAVVDVEEVANSAAKLPGVITAKHYVYMCSEPGQAIIEEDIKKLNLNRVVVASCSPRMHEPTYRKVLEGAGINPFFFEMANIREHVSWAHMKESDKATEKAKDLVRMAVARACLLEPVSKMEFKVVVRALVIGGGIAGITAARDLARKGFEVYLVEREPYIGGHLALLNKLYWGGDASEILASLTKDLSQLNVKVLTNSEVAEHVEGYLGNFNVKIIQNPRYVDENCNSCGKCSEVCPISVPNEVNFGLDQRKAIYLPLKNCYPPRYVIDKEKCNNCGQCLQVCEKRAIRFDEKPAEITVDVGAIVVTTGFEPYNPLGEFGYGEQKNVITQLTLERILSQQSPTEGKLLRPSDGKTPNSVAFIMCVGSRQAGQSQGEKQANPYCSRFCCSSTLKNIALIKEKHPATDIYVFYRDMRTVGRQQESLYRKARELGTNFIRFNPDNPPRVVNEDGQQRIIAKDLLFNVDMEIPIDLVVLVEGMVPRKDVAEMNSKLSITRSPDGFFQEAHPKMNPLDTFADGIFVGGTAQGPKDVIDTISQASGAAAKAAIPLSRGKVLIDLVTAVVDREVCTGCGKCVDVCPYKAIALDETEGIAKVTEVKCKGCGSCAATCPVGAMQIRHFRDDQILAMVENLLLL